MIKPMSRELEGTQERISDAERLRLYKSDAKSTRCNGCVPEGEALDREYHLRTLMSSARIRACICRELRIEPSWSREREAGGESRLVDGLHKVERTRDYHSVTIHLEDTGQRVR